MESDVADDPVVKLLQPVAAETRGSKPFEPAASAAPVTSEALPPPPSGDISMSMVALDRMMNAAVGRFSFGLSPLSLSAAYFDWLSHLVSSPGKQLQLAQKAARKWLRLGLYVGQCVQGNTPSEPCIVPLPQDRRFSDPAWQSPPYNVIYQSFLLMQQWWHNATTDVRGVSRHHENVVSFATRQLLDIFSPGNFALTNPLVAKATAEQGGMNMVHGLQNLMEDWQRAQLAGRQVGPRNSKSARRSQ